MTSIVSRGFLALIALGLLACAPPVRPSTAAPPAPVPDALSERHDLLMIATAAWAYANLTASPKPGYDIAALIAWDVEDLTRTPSFVLERNRNFEYQGDVHHAEINTIRRAYELRKSFDLSPFAPEKERIADYTQRLANTTLYTTLEPCPMCATTLLLARVPRAVYYMEDPGLRDLETRRTVISVPDAVYGRKLIQTLTTWADARRANEAMWQAARTKPFSITDYARDHGASAFKPAYDALWNDDPKHPQNADLLKALRRAVGKR